MDLNEPDVGADGIIVGTDVGLLVGTTQSERV